MPVATTVKSHSSVPWTDRLRRISWLDRFCFVAIVLGCCVSLKTVTSYWRLEPDTGHSLLMWYGVTQHGLGWLKDWLFTPDNWLLSLVPLHFLGFSIFGPHFAVPLLFGWLTFVGSAFACAAIAAAVGARKAAAPIAAALLNLGPYAHIEGFAAYPTSHNTTNLFGLLSLGCFVLWMKRRNWAFLLAAAILVTAGSISDPWMVAAFGLPFVIACLGLLSLPYYRSDRKIVLAILIATLVSLILFYTKLFGIFNFVPKVPFAVAKWDAMNSNSESLLKIFGDLINLSPGNYSPLFIPAFASILIVCAVLLGIMWRSEKNAARFGADKAFFILTAAFSVLGAVAAPVIVGSPAGARWLINTPYFVALALGVLATINWKVMTGAAKTACIALLAVFILSGVIGNARHWRPDPATLRGAGVQEEAAFLKANGLAYGYGPYWGANANAVTLFTHEKVRVRPVAFDPQTGAMVTGTRTQTSKRWYEPADVPAGTKEWFVIVVSDGEECPDVQRCLAGVEAEFGTPARTLRYANMDVLVWNHPLIGYHNPLPIDLNQRLEFSGTKPLLAGLEGWSGPEPWGVWTAAKAATIKLRLQKPPQGAVALQVQGHAYLGGNVDTQTIQVSVNGHPVGVLSFNRKENEGTRTLAVPNSDFGPDGTFDIDFLIDHPTAPKDVGESADDRKLGLGIEALTVSDQAPGASAS